MTNKVIEYKSGAKSVYKEFDLLETTEIEGIACSWTGSVGRYGNDNSMFNFTWNFDWTKLKNEGVDRISGHLIVKPSAGDEDRFQLKKICIDWREGIETISEFLPSENRIIYAVYAVYECHLTAYYGLQYIQMEQVSYDEMFAASDKTDAILVIDEKKVHVNKAFLSYHSDFFTALFSSNFKEGQLAEIPIKDVSYEDFGLLMSSINLKQVFQNDTTAPKLLELADRFLMPCVTNLVKHQLIHNPQLSENFPDEKMMWMADAYDMPMLLEKCIRAMDTKEKARTLQKSEEYKKLSFETKTKLFERLLQID